MKLYLQFGILISFFISCIMPDWNHISSERSLAIHQTASSLNLKLNPASDKDLIYIVIDSLKDKDDRANSIWGDNGYFFANEFFQKKLAADLKDDFGRRGYTIAFCTEDEANRDNIEADWKLSLGITYLYKYAPITSTVNIQVASQTLASNTVHSTDNSFGWPGNPPIYNTLYTQFQYSTATSAMVQMVLHLNIQNRANGKDIRDKIKSQYGGVKKSETVYDSQSTYPNAYLPVGVSSMNSLSDNIALTTLNSLYEKNYSKIKGNIEKAIN